MCCTVLRHSISSARSPLSACRTHGILREHCVPHLHPLYVWKLHVNLQGLVIKEHMRDIPHNCDPAPIIRIYVDLNLQTLHKAGVISGPVPMPAGAPQEAALPPASSGMQVADRDTSSAQGHMHSSGGPGSGQLPQAVQEDRAARTASSAVDNPPLSPAGSLTSPGSQASTSASAVAVSCLLWRCCV